MTARRALATIVVALALAACATQSTPTTDAAPPAEVVAVEPAAKIDPPQAPAPAATDAATTPPATPPAAPKPRVYWAVRMVPGPKWVAGKPANEQPGIEAHIENMAAWNERGLMYMGGPFLDGTGGMAVLRVKSAAEAKALIDDDPCVRSGLLVPEIHPWLCVYRTGD